jgi:alpha-tubulin suppressor-like RCC1 family protein
MIQFRLAFRHLPSLAPSLAALALFAAPLPSARSQIVGPGVYAWGNNQYGQLGNGTTTNSSTPVPVTGLSGVTVTAVAGGSEHSMVLTSTGVVYAWGYNAYGALGNGSYTDSNVPVAVSTAGVLAGQTVTALAGGNSWSLALANGKVYAWGYNNEGELGNGSYTPSNNVPVAVSTAGVLGGKTVTAVAAGADHSLAVANGQVYAWGYGYFGELGDGPNSSSNVPVAVSTAGVLGGKTVAAVAAGTEYSVAVANGHAYAWGFNGYGQLGNATTTDSDVPVAVSTAGVLGGKTVTAVAAGLYHSLAVANGQVYAWGSNGEGELGNGTTTDSDVPVAVTSSALSKLIVTEVAAGADSSYALTNTGGLFAWGENATGQLGIGSTATSFSTPQEVLPPTGYMWTSVDSEEESWHVVAIATPVPEPGSLGLVIAVAGLAGAWRLRRPTRTVCPA